MPHTKKTSGVERRVFERFPFRQNVKIQFFDFGTFEFSSVDISAGGIALRSHINFPADTLCKVEINIPITKGMLSFEENAELKHTIFRSGEDGFILGLHFTEIEPSLQTAIVCLMRGNKDKNNNVLDSIARLGRHDTQ